MLGGGAWGGKLASESFESSDQLHGLGPVSLFRKWEQGAGSGTVLSSWSCLSPPLLLTSLRILKLWRALGWSET